MNPVFLGNAFVIMNSTIVRVNASNSIRMRTVENVVTNAIIRKLVKMANVNVRKDIKSAQINVLN
jgi:hypothetical protein